MRKTRKYLAIVLSALLILLSLSLPGFASYDEDMPNLSGEQGDKITWTYEDGVLSIHGTGAIKPLTRVVEHENEVWDPDEEEYYTETYTETEEYYTWEEDLMTEFEDLIGYDLDDEMEELLASGKIRDVLYGYIHLVEEIYIDEGITSVSSDAFSSFYPRKVSLPSTLTASDDGAFYTLGLEDLYIYNSKASFNKVLIDIPAYFGYEAPFDTVDDLLNALIEMEAVSLELDRLLDGLEQEEVVLVTAFQVNKFIPLVNGVDPDDEDAMQEFIADYLEEYEEEFEAFIEEMQDAGFRGETLEALVEEALDRLNDALETNFRSLDEIFEIYEEEDEDDPDSSELSYRATKELIDAAEQMADYYEGSMDSYSELFDRLDMFPFGKSPVVTVVLENDEGDYEDTEVGVTPVPWLTVHADAGSTAKNAARKSTVRFECLEHDFESEVTAEPSCTEEGERTYYCTQCDYCYTETIEKTEHHLELWYAESPSCYSEGYTGDKVCTECGQTIEEGTTIPKLVHTDSDNDGYCDNCQEMMEGDGHCEYCGKIHDGPFGWLIKFFHRIMAFFSR